MTFQSAARLFWFCSRVEVLDQITDVVFPTPEYMSKYMQLNTQRAELQVGLSSDGECCLQQSVLRRVLDGAMTMHDCLGDESLNQRIRG